MTIGESSDNKSIMSKLWDKYSIEGQKKRIILGERLFRAAQYRANDPRWFTEARIPYEFRPRHALISMHIWFIHKRLLADRVDSHLALLVQEELFDILWNDTRARIRAEGVHELTVNKHLKDAQQLTFLQCTHYDHSFQEFASDDKKRLQEISGVNWTYVLNKDEEANEDLLKRLTMYVEYQCVNLLQGVPDNYFWEGRIPWGDMPEFATMKDNNGKELPALESVPGMEVFPAPWVKTLTDAGVPYYWNMDTDETTWKKPT
jgi:cytochrome b pre-mRNA-processing protein 3